MPRPTNQQIYDREPDLAEGTEAAVALVLSAYPDRKVLESDFKGDLGDVEVQTGWIDESGAAHIQDVLVSVTAEGTTLTLDGERPEKAPKPRPPHPPRPPRPPKP